MKTVEELEVELAKEKERGQTLDATLRDKEAALSQYVKYGSVDQLAAKGIELENYRKRVEELEKKQPDKSIPESERLTQAAAKIKELEDERNRLNSTLHEVQVVNGAWEKMSANFAPDALGLLKPVLKEKLMLNKDGLICVRGKDGEPEFVDGVKLKTIDEFSKELQAAYPSLVADKTIRGTMKPGELKKDSTNPGKVYSLQELSGLPKEQRREIMRKQAEERFKP